MTAETTDLYNLLKRVESSKASINSILDKLITELNEIKAKSSDPTVIIDIKSSGNGTITYMTDSNEITKNISKNELIDLCTEIQGAKNESIISVKCVSSASTMTKSLKKKSLKPECNYYYLIKDKTKRVDLLGKGFTIYVDDKSKYYTKCRLSSESGSNNCNRHINCSDNVDISRMTIVLFENKYLISNKLKMSCKLIIDNLSGSKEEYKIEDDIIVDKLSISDTSDTSDTVVVPVIVSAAALLSESEDDEDDRSTVIESSESEDDKSSSSESEEELEADEIHDINGKVYYVDQNKTVIVLDEDGCGEKIGRLVENKKGTIFYQSKKWTIQK